MLLKRLLPAYYKHMFTRPNSLLARFYGAYSIQIQGHTKCFVVMENLFHSAPGGKPHESYDLKGSWVDRHANVHDASSGAFKDMDLHKPLRLDRAVAQGILKELKEDSALLAKHNIMDYSLLLGAHNVEVPTKHLGLERRAEDIFGHSVDVPRYYLGMIDLLQSWNLQKRLERLAKIVFKGRRRPPSTPNSPNL